MMADSEVSKALRDFPNRVLMVPVEERDCLFANVLSILKNPNINSSIVRGICKVIGTTLTKYKDPSSQTLVRNLITGLLKTHPEPTLEHLNGVFKTLVTKDLVNYPVQKASKASLVAFGWSVLVLKNINNTSDKVAIELLKLMNYQSLFYQTIILSENKRLKETFEKILFDLWAESEVLFNEFYNYFSGREPATNVIILLMAMCRFKQKIQNHSNFVENNWTKLIYHFLTAIVTSKYKPNINYIYACQPLLKATQKYDFEDHIYPALKRSMLRSPEITIHGIGTIIKQINLDFSEYAETLGNPIIQNLYSKDEKYRAEAALSLKELSTRCSAPHVIINLLKKVFSILNGADGKITLAEYRINILQGAGNLSFNSIPTTEIEHVINIIIDLFSKVLANEIHEKVLCHTLDMLGLWSAKCIGILPKRMVELFKIGLENKSTTQAVRVAYLQWFLSALRNAQLENGVDISLLLVKSIEKANQNPSQINVLSEAVCAVCLILKTKNNCGDLKLSSFWNFVLDMSKNIFLTERYVTNASEDHLFYVTLMGQELLTKHYDDIKGPDNLIFKAIIHAATSQMSSETRYYCLEAIAAISRHKKGVKYAIKLLKELEIKLESLKTQNSWEGENNLVLCTIYVDLIKKICEFEGASHLDTNILGIHLLLCCHHPLIMQVAPELWEKVINSRLRQDAKLFVLSNMEEIITVLVHNYKNSNMYENALALIIKLCPELVLPTVLAKFLNDLRNLNIYNVTEEELFTNLTPDVELFDKITLPNSDDTNNDASFKRGSKLYSCKEEFGELELRKGTEEKRRKDGKTKLPHLTTKQKDAIKSQEDKEKLNEQKLQQLNMKLYEVLSLFKAACIGNSTQVSLHFPKILNEILCALKSHVAAELFADLYYDLGKYCLTYELKELNHNIAVCTLRLSKPRCNLKEIWIQKNLGEIIFETLIKLHETTVSAYEDRTSVNRVEQIYILNAPGFSYAFEFLKRAFVFPSIASNEEFVLMGIQIIEIHAQIKGETTNGELWDLRHPRFMPRLEICRTLLMLISSHRGRIQSQAVGCLLEVAQLSSGDLYCGFAEREEIELFLTSLENNLEAIRDIALRVLRIIVKTLPTEESDFEFHRKIICRFWIANYDTREENRALAKELWQQANLKFPEKMTEQILAEVTHPEVCIQNAAASALVPILEKNLNLVQSVLSELLALYHNKLNKTPPKLDQFDREVEPAIDPWKPRRGVAVAISQVAEMFSLEEVKQTMQFMVSQGLGDRNEIVQKEMLSAALRIVDLHGKHTIVDLLPVFEQFLDKAPKSQHFDNVRQAVVIVMGSLARHLEKNDERIEPIIKRLLAALSTPSQQVQEAVANCLPHLMPSVKEDVPALLKRLMQLLVKSDKYGERRGAAYGIAGIVKGLGILSLKQYEIMSKLTAFIQEKKSYRSREGALFAFEVLCTTLGRLFEPYIIHVLPHLLQCFGDSSLYVRQAADEAARVVMGKLSAHGVKLVLPSLLEALDKDSWRTKTASVELLGAMAFCAPKQLSSCLPSIVPKLIEVLGDSHTKVQEAGAGALKVIGSVIKNPEIQAIVPVLLTALEDPSKNTSICLHNLLQTKFVHFIDAPSLALIMPVVQRAFIDRSTETRKMAAQIIGNMYSLTDQKDLVPYLPNIIPGLKISLLDPVPEVRAVSARALGAIVKGMGESSFDELLPWLMQTLTSETNSVDRSGAAQGLSEVVGGLGIEKLHKLMPEIISTAERTDIAPHVKDGYIMMFIFMPSVFPKEFTPYIGHIINPILKALADENEYVRDTALKAGQRIVNLYAESAVTLLLPELENGLFDDNWRIRLSSVQLLGDLLYRISGVSGKMTTETASDDDNFGTEHSHTAIIRYLGVKRRNRVLAGLYMGRSDVSLMVRQAALHVWKVVVTNTPRTLKEILPTLFTLLLGCLANTSYDKRQVAARTLGDLARKLGERILPEIIPILEQGLNSNQADQRQGVCIGLSEIMASTSRDMILSFADSLIATVRKALSDPLPKVRQAAAKTFDSLHSTVGCKALDNILPLMLNDISDSDLEVAENTLDGLRQVMSIKPRVILPYLIPQLTAPPLNTKALSILVSVAGDALTKYLPKILTALLQALSDAQGSQTETQELEYSRAVILSVNDEACIRIVIDALISASESECLATRKSAASMLSAFCIHSSADYSQHVPQLLRCLLRLFVENDRDILQRACCALNSVVKSLGSSQQIAYVQDVRQAVCFAINDLKLSDLPGFSLPKGINPLLPLFREAILNGLPEEKENAAQGLGEVISLASVQSLQPSVVHITGPLIRILGDRFHAGVKAAVLKTLAILLHKVGAMLKQFLPQLQTTFLKALHDPNRTVRLKAGHAIAELVLIHSRADSLFIEMHCGIKNSNEAAFRETMIQSLRGTISQAGFKMSESLRKQVCITLIDFLNHPEDITRNGSAGCLGTLCKYVSNEQLDDILRNHILIEDGGEDMVLRHGRSTVAFVVLKECPSTVYTSNYENLIINHIIANITSEKIAISSNGVRAAFYLLRYCIENNVHYPQVIVSSFVRAMNHTSNDVKQLIAKSCAHLSEVIFVENTKLEFLKFLVPMLVNGTKEKNIYVKSNSEIALISILRLKHDEETYQKYCLSLEAGAKESLDEVVCKVLRKVVIEPIGKEELDNTIIF